MSFPAASVSFFFVQGVGQVITVDLNRRLEFGILEKSLVWMAENRDELYAYYADVAEHSEFDKRMNLLDRIKEIHNL